MSAAYKTFDEWWGNSITLYGSHRLSAEAGWNAALHTNLCGDASKKGRGHAGSELHRKAESIFKLSRDLETDIRLLTCEKNRNAADTLTTAFKWSDAAGMFISTDERPKAKKPAAAARHEELAAHLRSIQENWTFSALIEAIMQNQNVDKGKAKNIYQALSKSKLIDKGLLGTWIVKSVDLW